MICVQLSSYEIMCLADFICSGMTCDKCPFVNGDSCKFHMNRAYIRVNEVVFDILRENPWHIEERKQKFPEQFRVIRPFIYKCTLG